MKKLASRFVMVAALAGVHLIVPTPSFANQAEVIGECQISQWDWMRRYQLKIAHEPNEFADLFINAMVVPELERDEQNVWQLVRAADMDLNDAIDEHMGRFAQNLDKGARAQLQQRLQSVVSPIVELRSAISVAYFAPLAADQPTVEAEVRGMTSWEMSVQELEARVEFWRDQDLPIIFDDTILLGVAINDLRTEKQIADGLNPSLFPTRGGCAFFEAGFRYANRMHWDHAQRQYPTEAAVLDGANFYNRVVDASWNDVFGPYRR